MSALGPIRSFSLVAVLLSAGVAPAEPALGRYTIAKVAEQVTPAVVNITTRQTGRANPHPFFFGPSMPRGGAGSGVVIDASGVIVTNNHVVDKADEIRVTFPDKREFVATRIGQDKASDLAFLKIKATGLPYLKLGDSSKLRLGELVLAVGNPFGVGQTVTMGIVSAKGRGNMGIVEYEDFIQTDAAINPGNSGGALVNLDGELVGINTAILSRSGGAQGVGFSVPSNMVKPIRAQIEAHGKVRRAWLGVQIQDLTPELAKSMGIPRPTGVLVSEVLDGGPADTAGLRSGDVILAVNGETTANAAQLKNRIALTPPGSKARLRLLRDGRERSLSVTLNERDDSRLAGRGGRALNSKNRLLSGLTLRALNPELREHLDIPPRVQGLLVSKLQAGSVAARSGLRRGDVITAINRRPVRRLADVEARIGDRDTRALLRVFGRGGFHFIVLH